MGFADKKCPANRTRNDAQPLAGRKERVKPEERTGPLKRTNLFRLADQAASSSPAIAETSSTTLRRNFGSLIRTKALFS
jgi:hypothetical protein